MADTYQRVECHQHACHFQNVFVCTFLSLLLQALGFAGPSYISKAPENLWCCAVHQADVLFFWDAAEDWRVAEVGCGPDTAAGLDHVLCKLQPQTVDLLA